MNHRSWAGEEYQVQQGLSNTLSCPRSKWDLAIWVIPIFFETITLYFQEQLFHCRYFWLKGPRQKVPIGWVGFLSPLLLTINTSLSMQSCCRGLQPKYEMRPGACLDALTAWSSGEETPRYGELSGWSSQSKGTSTISWHPYRFFTPSMPFLGDTLGLEFLLRQQDICVHRPHASYLYVTPTIWLYLAGWRILNSSMGKSGPGKRRNTEDNDQCWEESRDSSVSMRALRHHLTGATIGRQARIQCFSQQMKRATSDGCKKCTQEGDTLPRASRRNTKELTEVTDFIVAEILDP